MIRLTSGMAAAGFLCASAAGAAGQQVTHDTTHDTKSSDIRSCEDTLQAGNLTRLTIFQQAALQDTTPAVNAQVELVAERIAVAARSALGARHDDIPFVDAFGVWPRGVLHLPFVVVLHREQPGTWRSDTTSDTISAKVTGFYEHVLSAVPPDSIWMIWPDGYAQDSVEFRLTLISGNGDVRRMAAEHSMFAVFSTKGIAERPALLKENQPPPRFPLDALHQHIAGFVLLQFVIGTDGRADLGTLKVLRPTADTLRASPLAHYYQEFVAASEDAISNARFYPARIGACAVRERVQFPFTYLSAHLSGD